MKDLIIGSSVYVVGGDWKGMEGVITDIEGSAYIVALGTDHRYAAIDSEDLEIIVKYSDLEYQE